MIGRVAADPWVDRVKNGSGKAIFLQVRFSAKDDVRTVQYLSSPGEEEYPIKGDKVAVYTIGGILVAVAGQGSGELTCDPGTKNLYGRDATGTRVSKLALRKSGKAYLGNPVNGKNLKASLDALSDALSIFAGACMGSQTDPVLVAAATNLSTAVGQFKIGVSLFLDGSA